MNSSQKNVSTPYKDPRKIKSFSIDSDSQASTEEMSGVSQDSGIEETVRVEIQEWLSLHGAKLFALESSKYLAKTKTSETAVRGRRPFAPR